MPVANAIAESIRMHVQSIVPTALSGLHCMQRESGNKTLSDRSHRKRNHTGANDRLHTRSRGELSYSRVLSTRFLFDIIVLAFETEFSAAVAWLTIGILGVLDAFDLCRGKNPLSFACLSSKSIPRPAHLPDKAPNSSAHRDSPFASCNYHMSDLLFPVSGSSYPRSVGPVSMMSQEVTRTLKVARTRLPLRCGAKSGSNTIGSLL